MSFHRAAILCLATLAGCADESPTRMSTAEAQLACDATHAAVRFVHGSPTSPAFDIYVGAASTPAFANVAFGAATPYLQVAPADVALVVRAAGAAPSDAPLFTSELFAAQAGETITAIAGGVLGATLPAIRFRIQPYSEAFADAARGHARVRFVHDSHGVAAANLDLEADGTLEVAGLAPFAASDAAGVELARRDVQLAVSTGAPAKALTSFTVPREVLAQRGGVFLALVGVPAFVPHDVRGLALLAIGHDTTMVIRQNPTLYLLAGVADAATLDVHAFGHGVSREVAGLGFGALAPLQVPPDERGYHLALTVGDRVAIQPTGRLQAGERYLAIASGFAARVHERILVHVVQDAFERTITANGRLRAVAASPDAPALDFGQFPPGSETFVALPGLAALAYRAASDAAGLEVTPAPLNPGVRVTGTSQSFAFRTGALTATDRAFGVAAGALAPGDGEIGTRFVVVKAPASGSWTATTLAPQ